MANLLKVDFDPSKRSEKVKKRIGFEKEKNKNLDSETAEIQGISSPETQKDPLSFSLTSLISEFRDPQSSLSIDTISKMGDQIRTKLKKKLFMNRLISFLKQNDVIFLLKKIENFKKQFMSFDFLQGQDQSEIKSLGINYEIESTRGKEGEGKGRETESGFKEIETKPDEMYSRLTKYLESTDSSQRNLKIRINLSSEQVQLMTKYVATSLNTIHQRIQNLKQQKKLKIKEKNKISKIANDFFYDQKAINELTKNYNKVEDFTICQIFKNLNSESESNGEEKDGNGEFTCFRYNQVYPFGLEHKCTELTRTFLNQYK